MKKLLFIVAGCAVFGGCTTADKTRHIDVSGAYANGMAFGSVEVQTASDESESAMVSYKDSVAWFSDAKEHDIRILLTGTNSVQSAGNIVSNICAAFVATAPVLTDASGKACKCGADCKCEGVCKCDEKKEVTE